MAHGAILRPNRTELTLKHIYSTLSLSECWMPTTALPSWFCLHFIDQETEAWKCLKSQSWLVPRPQTQVWPATDPGYLYYLLVHSSDKQLSVYYTLGTARSLSYNRGTSE